MVSEDQTGLTLEDAALPVVDLAGLFTGNSADRHAVARSLGTA
ncbi:MAG: hypothetical protein ACJAQW_001419, partial [Paracoccaceae bacterium]